MRSMSCEQPPLLIPEGMKKKTRMQVAALCHRMKNDTLQVLLVTSRTRRRWILPQGWPENGLTPAQAALIEAREEGGITGHAQETCIGVYSYVKKERPYVAMIFPISVTTIMDHYKEQDQRDRDWFSLPKAAQKVAEPTLAQVLKTLDIRHLQSSL